MNYLSNRTTTNCPFSQPFSWFIPFSPPFTCSFLGELSVCGSFCDSTIFLSLVTGTYTLRPKIFAPFDFYRTHLTIRLIQKICANVKTIMIYLKYIWQWNM
jgi:hypothetical protein